MKILDTYLEAYMCSDKYSRLVVDKVENNSVVKEASKNFNDALNKIAPEFKKANPVDSAANYIEAVAMEIIFKEAFRQGACFILDLMNSDKEETSI